MNILILSAVNSEIKYLKEKLNLIYPVKCSFADSYTGNLNDHNIFLLITGPGTVNTSGALTVAIEFFEPDLIIQTGIGGSFKESGMELGDIGIATSEIDIQLGLESSDKIVDPLPFDVFVDENGPIANSIDIDKDYVDQAYNILKKDFKTFYGPFVSVSTITCSDNRALSIYNECKPIIESMEGFASAQISRMCNIPYIQIRSISNWVGKRDRDSWKIDQACENCSKAVFHYIKNIT